MTLPISYRDTVNDAAIAGVLRPAYGFSAVSGVLIPAYGIAPPFAFNVRIVGPLYLGAELTAVYDYDGPTESGTTYQWYRADDASGANSVVITDADETTYTLTEDDVDKFIRFGVTPSDGTTVGVEAFSQWGGAVEAEPPPIFSAVTYSGNSSTQDVVTGFDFTTDQGLVWIKDRDAISNHKLVDTVRGATWAWSTNTGAEVQDTDGLTAFTSNGFSLGANAAYNTLGNDYIAWAFKKQTGAATFLTYTGDGLTEQVIAHDLGVVPEWIMVKYLQGSAQAGQGRAYMTASGVSVGWNIRSTGGSLGTSQWNDKTPTSTEFYVGSAAAVNQPGGEFIAYLFATLAGVSKVGSYTGTAATLDIDCGFTGMASFVWIKRIGPDQADAGPWYIWDSARGIIVGDDPYLLSNSDAAEVTNTDYLAPYATGFTVTASAPAELNAVGGTYVFLAFA